MSRFNFHQQVKTPIGPGIYQGHCDGQAIVSHSTAALPEDQQAELSEKHNGKPPKFVFRYYEMEDVNG